MVGRSERWPKNRELCTDQLGAADGEPLSGLSFLVGDISAGGDDLVKDSAG